MRIRMLFLALAGLLLLSGCAQFMVPTEIGPVMTAEKRAAFYKMVDQGVANTAAGLPMLALINAMLEKKPGLEEMKEKWIPAGIKAYVRHSYVSSLSDVQQDAWEELGRAYYTAHFTELNESRLFGPVANLAYFCTLAGGEFRLDKDKPGKKKGWQVVGTPVGLTPLSAYRPVDGYAEWDHYPFTKLGQAADRQRTLIQARDEGAWGKFVCNMPEESKTWWALIEPDWRAKDWNNGMGWSLQLAIQINETPPFTKLSVPAPGVTFWLDTAALEAYGPHNRGPGKRVAWKEGDFLIEGWSTDKIDRWGCQPVFSRISYGDRYVGYKEKVLCF